MKRVECLHCGKVLYEKLNVIDTPWSGKAYKRTLHDKDGKELKSCPQCGYTGDPPNLDATEKYKIREDLQEEYSNYKFNTRKERASFFPDRPFKDLIYQNYTTMNIHEVHEAIKLKMALLENNEKEASEELIDVINLQANSDDFWNEESNTVFNEIWDTATEILIKRNIVPDKHLLFSLFQIVILNFTITAFNIKDFRKYISPRKQTKSYRWIQLVVAGLYVIYILFIGEFTWSTLVIAGVLVLIIEGYFQFA